jgi:hypothetical protein
VTHTRSHAAPPLVIRSANSNPRVLIPPRSQKKPPLARRLVTSEGFEPPTNRTGICHSIQLNYEANKWRKNTNKFIFSILLRKFYHPEPEMKKPPTEGRLWWWSRRESNPGPEEATYKSSTCLVAFDCRINSGRQRPKFTLAILVSPEHHSTARISFAR